MNQPVLVRCVLWRIILVAGVCATLIGCSDPVSSELPPWIAGYCTDQAVPSDVKLELRMEVQRERSDRFVVRPYVVNRSDDRILLGHSSNPVVFFVFRRDSVYAPEQVAMWDNLVRTTLEPGETHAMGTTGLLPQERQKLDGRFYAVAAMNIGFYEVGIAKGQEELFFPAKPSRHDFWLCTDPVEMRF